MLFSQMLNKLIIKTSRMSWSPDLLEMFEGQKCYSIDINKLDPPVKFDGGVDTGLELVIDLNEEKSIGTTDKNKKGNIQ